MPKTLILYALFLASALLLSVPSDISKATDPCPGPDEARSRERDRVLDSFVEVMVTTEDQKFLSAGTGVAANKNTILTAAHVVNHPRQVSVSSVGFGRDGYLDSVSPAEVLATNVDYDIAVLYVDDLYGRDAGTIPYFSGRDLPEGSEVCIFSSGVGFVRGFVIDLSGVPSYERFSESWFYWASNSPVEPGSSGGAIYARIDGKLFVVGLVTAGTKSHSGVYVKSGEVYVETAQMYLGAGVDSTVVVNLLRNENVVTLGN